MHSQILILVPHSSQDHHFFCSVASTPPNPDIPDSTIPEATAPPVDSPSPPLCLSDVCSLIAGSMFILGCPQGQDPIALKHHIPYLGLHLFPVLGLEAARAAPPGWPGTPN